MENTNKKFSLSKNERFKVMVRSMFLQGSWNFERMQNLGFLYAILPALKKFYPAGSDGAKAALKRHMEFFNTHPYPAAPIIGVTLALEEEIANGGDVDEAAIQGVKVGMMGPLAGVGDPVFWFTVRPIVGAVAASLATGGSIIAPLFFFFVWNIIRIAFLWYTQEFGYKQGVNITSDLGGGFLQTLTKGASILGMFILGALIQRWVNISFAGPNAMLPKQPIQDGGYIDFPKGSVSGTDLHNILGQFKGGLSLENFKQQSLNDVFNSLIPGFVALLLTFLVIAILRKWKSKNAPLVIIIALFVVGILLRVAGLA
ncbi:MULTISPECIES: PTS system mannose/fructose/sorbose family transporter subunit IID [Lactococcus]|uniref:PTS mannose/fructose/sorbose transporter family subunit IID n=2 Tax=Lactococcus TaxID=1357 RepID=A0A387BDY5_9LACT|nr:MULTISPECIES: PTS system mannose/fructose/sorbose family transporter subunit IID [Lactococcus]AYG00738.1 PTS mannose/fructose/sorbose transporter family subunit IID [Lactococcus allomyrinae]MCL2112932.1 PTS system mannose/fructose/sorbose family transporter subunit IID [Streptococcaceae bacterium]QDK71672.1 PTS mannose/fructose/sorbose transporter family subunit IID [Lactococcus protaetiae]